MKKRCIHGFAAIYVMAAILIAHTALVSPEATASRHTNQGSVVGQTDDPVRNHQRLSQSDESRRQADKANYTVEIWTADWCGKCPAYKRRVQPALLKLGYTVTIKDWDIDARPKKMRAVPSVCLYYKGAFLQMWVAPPAVAIDLYVEQRMSLKGTN
jgi:hypothetical protein